MTPQEALAQALVEVEESKLPIECIADTCGHEDGCDIDTALGCGDAAAILAALPEGWALTNGITNIEDWPIWQQAREEGAQQERERLRPLVMALTAFLPAGYGRLRAWGELYDALLP